MSKQLINVEMPDGTIIEGVPEGVTQGEVMRRYAKMKGAAEVPGILAAQAAKYPSSQELFKRFASNKIGPEEVMAATGLGKITGGVESTHPLINNFITEHAGNISRMLGVKTNEPNILEKAMKHVQDFTTGIDKAGGSFIQAGGDWVANSLGMKVPPPRMTPTGRDVFAPDNTAQAVGNVAGKVGLGIAGGMAGGPTLAGGVAAGGLTGALQNPDSPEGPAALGMVAPMVGAGINAIPRTSRAAANFDKVDAVAGKVPINPAAADAVAARAKELSGRGATLPKVFRDYIRERGVNPDEITYEVARDFAKNSGRLSAAEKQMANPEMKMLMGNFYNALKTANREAAVKVGMGEVYDDAIREFRQASSISDTARIAAKYAKKGLLATALGAAAGGAAYKMLGN